MQSARADGRGRGGCAINKRDGVGANRLFDICRPVEPGMFLQHWSDGCAGCGRWGWVSYLALGHSCPSLFSCIRLFLLLGLLFARSILLLHSLLLLLSPHS